MKTNKNKNKKKRKDVELDNPDLEEEVGITMNDDEGDHKLNNQKSMMKSIKKTKRM